MNVEKTIMELSGADGPSGSEQGVFPVAAALLKPYMDTVTKDVMGNLIGIRRGRTDACLLLDAHLDEVCLMVTGHDKGFLQFAGIGIDPRLLPGLEVKLLTEPPRYGVVTCLPPHILTAEEREKAFEPDKLRIDCGLSEQEALRQIPVGTPAVTTTKPFKMGRRILCGKALDNRACFAILVRAMELLKDKELPVDVVVLGSLQEEYTGMGARTACFSMMPDRAIAVDVTFAGTPDCRNDSTFPLGGGPTIGFGPTLNRRMSQALEQCAKKSKLPYAREILQGDTGTNSMQMQISREGVAAACVSLPLRYMHTPVETVDIRDAENTAKLLAAYVLSLGEEEDHAS